MLSDIVRAFCAWCKLKISLSQKSSAVVFNEGEIWWCNIGFNIGEEVRGKGAGFTRPVLILRKFTKNSFLGLPLTRQEKTGSWYVEVSIHGRISRVMLNQARSLDRKRLTNRIMALESSDFTDIQTKFRKFCCPEK